VGGGGEVGGRCTSQGGAKQAARGRPNALLSVGPGGDPAAHPTPNTQHPTPNAQRPTPNAQKINPHGSRRQPEGYFRSTCRGALQSIPSGDLVVAAGRGIQRLTPNTQRPPTPSKQMLPSKRPTPGRPCRPSRVAKIQACHPHKRHPHKPQCQSSLLAPGWPCLPRGTGNERQTPEAPTF
jgi:hypothetical protein